MTLIKNFGSESCRDSKRFNRHDVHIENNLLGFSVNVTLTKLKQKKLLVKLN